jgi:hypothetical protein
VGPAVPRTREGKLLKWIANDTGSRALKLHIASSICTAEQRGTTTDSTVPHHPDLGDANTRGHRKSFSNSFFRFINLYYVFRGVSYFI